MVTLNTQLRKDCPTFCCQTFVPQFTPAAFLQIKTSLLQRRGVIYHNWQKQTIQHTQQNKRPELPQVLGVNTATADTSCLGLKADSNSLRLILLGK